MQPGIALPLMPALLTKSSLFVFQQGMPAVSTGLQIYTKIYLYIFIDTPNNML